MTTALEITAALWLLFNALLFAALGVERSRQLVRAGIDNFHTAIRGQS